jgi:glycosyltransferase involved in cell wall biosynthesis
MNKKREFRGRRPAVLVIGPFPPPLHGAALITDRIASSLDKIAKVTKVNLSSGRMGRNGLYHATRIFRAGRAFWLMLSNARGVQSIYFSISGGMGQIYDVILIATARIVRQNIFIHHHSYAYFSKRTLLAALIAKVAGARATHICLCDDMTARVRTLYPEAKRVLTVSNAALVGTPRTRAPGSRRALVLGHLSNLLPEKGVDTVLEVFRRCQAAGLSTRLILAGPMSDPGIQKLVGDLEEDFSSLFEYRGSAHDEKKQAFFRDIDVFLFPTRYRNEAEPLVILEALAAGVPVIAFSRGCILNDVGDAGLVLREDEDFVDQAVATLANYVNSPKTLEKASKRATGQAMALYKRSQHDLRELQRQLVG